MYGMLVVDDEKWTVQSICESIDWASADITGVYAAHNVEEAIRVFGERRIDLLLADIEMRGGSGLDLVAWVNEHRPDTETIVLTGHANFEYAQRALQLDCFAYMLKPVDYGVLFDTVARALRGVKQQQEWNADYEVLRTYKTLWEQQAPVLTERFWQDLLARRIAASPGVLDETLARYRLPLTHRDAAMPVLVSVEHWHMEMSTQDEAIMEFALRKAAEEIILGDMGGETVQDRGGALWLLIWQRDVATDVAQVERRCRQFIEAAHTYFHCSLSCYIGRATALGQLADSHRQLVELERNSVLSSREVIRFPAEAEQDRPAASLPAAVPDFIEWGALLDNSQLETFRQRMAHLYAQLEDELHPSADSLLQMYHGLVYLFSRALHRKGSSLEAIRTVLLDRDTAMRSLRHLREWTHKALAQLETLLDVQLTSDQNEWIEKVKRYIDEHLHENVSRQELAQHVFLNPSYLSRLFKRETGVSISDYMLERRMKLAGKRLAESDQRIGDIAESIGFNHFSHFRKMFKKTFGVSPQEYRRQSSK
ncbi:helix-turn-helix domain-containing protein [Paenibacillus cymbidii]|uniref:helix-turn-helix domain-containing protein n=1 Tax=Paenibacillus cymbidii TaxID=1639034 RepID=UPI0014369085|nr:helix-turn-helix domain-containing protein [Paenibacillus cymbidii]